MYSFSHKQHEMEEMGCKATCRCTTAVGRLKQLIWLLIRRLEEHQQRQKQASFIPKHRGRVWSVLN